jgi:hypothetical protein
MCIIWVFGCKPVLSDGHAYPEQHKCIDVWAPIEESELSHACVLTKNWIVADGNLDEDAVLYETNS